MKLVLLTAVVGLCGGCSLARGVTASSATDGSATDAAVAVDAADAPSALDTSVRDAADLDGADLDGAVSDAFAPDLGIDAPTCTTGETRCASATSLERCALGAWMSTDCPLGCASDSPARCTTFDVSNVSLVLSGVSGPDVHVLSSITVDTTTCTGLPSATGRVVAQDMTGPAVCLYELGALTIDASAVVGVRGMHPLVVVADGIVQIDGTLDASSHGGLVSTTGSGSGTGGADGGDGGSGNMGTEGGGGGGAFGGDGANGADSGMSSSGGRGGSHATSTLMPLVGGASGGSGSGGGGAGGLGGGAIQITSRQGILIAGTILAAGSGGAAGFITGAGGGGGSGGALLFESPLVTLALSALVSVAGGGGGSGGCFTSALVGNDGQDGADAGAGRAMGGAMTSCGGTHGGGQGGGGSTVAGEAPSNGGIKAAGGGGGTGWIVFHTADGTLPTGATNPSSGPVVASRLATH